MRICVDIDGVLFPWDRVAREALEDHYGRSLGPSSYWHAIRDAVPSAEWRWLWSAAGQASVFGQIERCYEGAVQVVRSLLRDGHEVHFVTHRDPRLTAIPTARFLDRHFGGEPPWAGMHLVKSRTPKKDLGPWDVLIDDKPSTVLDVVAGETTMVFAPLRTWNVDDLEEADGPHLCVYEDPQEILVWVRGQE